IPSVDFFRRSGLLARARSVIALGDIDAVRAALSKSVDGGNASSALDLGMTYDPNILGLLGARMPSASASASAPASAPASASADLRPSNSRVLDELNIMNISPNITQARAWYQRAQKMGAPEAAALLDALGRRAPQTR